MSRLWVALGLVACLGACDSDDESEDMDPSTSSDASTKDASASDAARSDAAADASKGDAGTADAATLTTTIMTQAGAVSGEAVMDSGKRVLFFRGIPYAAAPIGALRWKPPQPVVQWSGTRDATRWGNRCPQGESTLSSPGAMSEDCLNLNVLTPAAKSNEKLPVMVFFHGGGLTIGTGNSTTYCNPTLPAQGVVVVTVNSRLNVFGYFSHPALAAESGKEGSGNYGTLDLIESLKWVKNNITAFGGDPGNVTIFGESGGGSKVLSCMASPLAKGLFHRAIIESGSRSAMPNATTTRMRAEAGGQKVAAKLGATSDGDVLAQLRSKTYQEVFAAATATDVACGALGSAGSPDCYVSNLTVDNWVLPQPVNEMFAQGMQANVPLIVGANEGEAGEFVMSIPSLAASMKSVTSKAYVYNFIQLPAGWRTPGCYSFHGLELAYVFGHMDGVNAATTLFLGMQAGCMTMLDPMISDEDRQVAANTMKIWVQFAKTGNPAVPGLTEWPAYTSENDTYLEIGPELKVKTGVATSGKSPPRPDAGAGDAAVSDAGITGGLDAGHDGGAP